MSYRCARQFGLTCSFSTETPQHDRRVLGMRKNKQDKSMIFEIAQHRQRKEKSSIVTELREATSSKKGEGQNRKSSKNRAERNKKEAISFRDKASSGRLRTRRLRTRRLRTRTLKEQYSSTHSESSNPLKADLFETERNLPTPTPSPPPHTHTKREEGGWLEGEIQTIFAHLQQKFHFCRVWSEFDHPTQFFP